MPLLDLVKRALSLVFQIHDMGSAFLAAHFTAVQRFLLALAPLTLFGFGFPMWRSAFGEWAANLLIVILFLSPLSRITRMRLLLQLMGLRRQLGILMASLATVHGVGYVRDPEWFALFIAPHMPGDFLGIAPPLLFGMAAYFLTLPLLFTSNNFATRLLGGRSWKRLHRLVYLLFAFAVLHRFFIRGMDGQLLAFVQALLLLGAYALVKLFAWKPFPPLVRLVDWVGERYREWQAAKSASTGATNSNA